MDSIWWLISGASLSFNRFDGRRHVRYLTINIVEDFRCFAVAAAFMFRVDDNEGRFPFVVRGFLANYSGALLIEPRWQVPNYPVNVDQMERPDLFRCWCIFRHDFVDHFLRRVSFNMDVNFREGASRDYGRGGAGWVFRSVRNVLFVWM